MVWSPFAVIVFRGLDALDNSLLQAIKKGDRRAQLKLYESYFSLLMGVAIRYRIDPDKSSELINDAFIKALKNLDRYQAGTSFKAWIKTIMIHTVIDDFRKKQRNREVTATDEQLEYGSKQVTYNDYVQDERIREILKVLEVLPPATRYVFNLFALEGYAHKEIAELLSISVETSKWHVKEARKKLSGYYQYVTNE